MDLFKRACKCGPGGWKCRCCGPAPGKERKEVRRIAKRRLRQSDSKSFRESLDGDE